MDSPAGTQQQINTFSTKIFAVYVFSHTFQIFYYGHEAKFFSQLLFLSGKHLLFTLCSACQYTDLSVSCFSQKLMAFYKEITLFPQDLPPKPQPL